MKKEEFTKGTVKNIMTKKVVTASANDSIEKILKVIRDKSISCVVITEKKKPIGIFTERDISKKIAGKDVDTKNSLISDVMSAPIIPIDSELSLLPAGEMMEKYKFRRFPVIKDEKLIGIITETDMVIALVEWVKHLNWLLVNKELSIEAAIEKIQEISKK